MKMKKMSSISLAVCTAMVVCLFIVSASAQAARKAKGEVISSANATSDACAAVKDLLEKPDECSKMGLPHHLAVSVIKSKKNPRLKKDQSILLKAREAGKTPARVIEVMDLPLDLKSFREAAGDSRNLILWVTEDGKKAAMIQPEKDFMPGKGQQVKIKVKEAIKVEGC